MQSLGVRLDGHSLSIMLGGGACVHHPRGLELGKQIHGYVIRSSLVHDPFIGSLLINMYAKCKRPLDACLVFDDVGERNAFAWNALLRGLAQNGLWETSLEFFILMKNEGYENGIVTLYSAFVGDKWVRGCFFLWVLLEETNERGELPFCRRLSVLKQCFSYLSERPHSFDLFIPEVFP
ncbi:pentatricopeptide repeat-containing protein [Cinnamomum micranthum f. kanehirae]|uniref:Pentatricopeptide repeat-containing protein n=1 Tax=Cinnamomum micranthum f. kanehirae TaxID=337451 RepID=A0A3S3MG85_9MAGN|nr:pentatricopeptide repeat-containing protein [Cinnamomum micranthum f. kanehirae]